MFGRDRLILLMITLAMGLLVAQNTNLPEAINASAEDDTFTYLLSGEEFDGELKVEILKPQTDVKADVKRILIYHTHTYEAYQQDPKNEYKQLEKWRTKDDKHNMIAVGRVLSSSLEALGFKVTHDTTAFEPPTLSNAYERSLSMLMKRQAEGERYDLYIDLHRDAIASTNSIKRTVRIGETEVARFMLLIGQGTTGGYGEKPDWLANKAIADSITKALNAQIDGLARDVKIKTGRFNQHVDDCCILIECGTNWNTLEEVINGIPYLAQAIEVALKNK